MIGGHDVENRMAQKLNIDARHADIESRILALGVELPSGTSSLRDEKVEINRHLPYNMAKSQSNRRRIAYLIAQHHRDPAMQVREP